MIKLLHVLPSLKIGGAESLVVNILRNMNRRVFDIALCVLFPPQNTRLEGELKREKIPVYYLGKHIGVDFRIPCRINFILSKFRPCIIHTHNYVMRYTILPTILSNIPLRMHTMHNIAQREVDLAGKIIHWLAFNLFSVMPISISNSVAKSVKKVYGVFSPVIYNGIPSNHFATTQKSITKKKSETIFINISRFRPQKNHRLLIEAFAEAVKIDKDMKLFLVGDGPLRSSIEKLVIEKNLGNSILFLGIRNDIRRFLGESDVYVSSSEWEGFGLSIVEAMAAGKPVIATKVGAASELLGDEENGLLVPRRDAKAMTSAILRLATNPELCRKMGQKNRMRACEKFDIAITVKNYEELYMKLYKKYLNQNRKK